MYHAKSLRTAGPFTVQSTLHTRTATNERIASVTSTPANSLGFLRVAASLRLHDRTRTRRSSSN